MILLLGIIMLQLSSNRGLLNKKRQIVGEVDSCLLYSRTAIVAMSFTSKCILNSQENYGHERSCMWCNGMVGTML